MASNKLKINYEDKESAGNLVNKQLTSKCGLRYVAFSQQGG